MKHWKLSLVLLVLVGVGIYLGDFYFTRWIHYKMSYQSLVRGEIHQMVKASCLQE